MKRNNQNIKYRGILFFIFLYALGLTGFSQTQTITLDVAEDALLFNWGGDATTVDQNYIDHDYICALAWTRSGSNNYCRSLLKFDFSSLPSNAIISSATLKLYGVDDGLTWADHNPLSGSNSCKLYMVDEGWSDNTVTWNSSPTYFGDEYVSLSQSTGSYQDYQVDITHFVNLWLSGTEENHGMFMKLDTESKYRRMYFASSDHFDSTLHPKLEIVYTIPSVNPEEIYDMVQLGEGTSVSGTTSTNGTITSPFGTYWHDNKSQYLVKKEELQSLGYAKMQFIWFRL